MKLFFSAPVHDRPEPRFVTAFAATCVMLRAWGIDCYVEMPEGESLITRARNNAVARFLADKSATHLLFIDADQIFRPEHVRLLLDASQHHPLVGGLVPKKAINWPEVKAAVLAGKDPEAHAAYYVFNARDGQRATVTHGCYPVDAIGTGMMLVTRDVIGRMIAADPALAYYSDDDDAEPSPRWAVFDTGIADGRYLSEDYLFCRRARALGVQPHIHLGIQDVAHIGKYIYRGSVQALFLEPVPVIR